MRSRRGRRVAVGAVAGIVLFAAGAMRVPTTSGGSYGVYCDSCRDAVINTFGIEFRMGQLWTATIDGTLTRLDHCQPVEVISVQGFRGAAGGLGWDSQRDEFAVTDAKLDIVQVIDLRGNVVREFPAPGTGGLGIAYDPTRDAYWITDFETDSLYGLHALDGGRLAAFPLRGVRAAGAAYDAARDGIIYEDRVLDAKGYVISCMSGALLDSFPLPFTGLNGWEDNTLAPDGSLWIHDDEAQKTYCIEHHTTPVRRVSWGALKRRYRP